MSDWVCGNIKPTAGELLCSLIKVIPEKYIAHPNCTQCSRHQPTLMSVCIYTMYTKWWLLLNCFACGDKSFFFCVNAEITFFLCNEYGPISFAE